MKEQLGGIWIADILAGFGGAAARFVPRYLFGFDSVNLLSPFPNIPFGLELAVSFMAAFGSMYLCRILLTSSLSRRMLAAIGVLNWRRAWLAMLVPGTVMVPAIILAAISALRGK